MLAIMMNSMKNWSMKPALDPMSTILIMTSRLKQFLKKNEMKMMKMSLMLTKKMAMSDSAREEL